MDTLVTILCELSQLQISGQYSTVSHLSRRLLISHYVQLPSLKVYLGYMYAELRII